MHKMPCPVGVVHRRQRLLAAKTRQAFGSDVNAARQQLDRDAAAQLCCRWAGTRHPSAAKMAGILVDNSNVTHCFDLRGGSQEKNLS